MARGWESKSIEEQQSISSDTGTEQPRRNPADLAKESERRAIELQISRIEQQLASATNERHRAMLRLACADLQKKLQAL